MQVDLVCAPARVGLVVPVPLVVGRVQVLRLSLFVPRRRSYAGVGGDLPALGLRLLGVAVVIGPLLPPGLPREKLLPSSSTPLIVSLGERRGLLGRGGISRPSPGCVVECGGPVESDDGLGVDLGALGEIRPVAGELHSDRVEGALEKEGPELVASAAKRSEAGRSEGGCVSVGGEKRVTGALYMRSYPANNLLPAAQSILCLFSLLSLPSFYSHLPSPFPDPPFRIDVEYESLEYLPVLLGGVLEESLPRSSGGTVEGGVEPCVSEGGGGISYVEGKGGGRKVGRLGGGGGRGVNGRGHCCCC